MAQVVIDDVWFCDDCTLFHVNGDLPEDDADDFLSRLEEWDGYVVPDFDADEGEDNGIEEFSSCSCDSCGSRVAGGRHRFAVLN